MATYRALLVGIDAYDLSAPLTGNVNNVDALARILPQVAPLPVDICSLVAPHRDHRALAHGESLPTRDNMVHALQELTKNVRRGDRALFYYSGHGTSAFVAEASGFREALLPKDFNNGAGLLWDLELGGLLDRLFAACGDLTVILDACFAAGATRSLSTSTRPRLTPRQVGLTAAQMRALVPPDTALTGDSASARNLMQQGAPKSYTVVAASHSFQSAYEGPFPEGQFGLLTYALLEVLRETPRETLHGLRWADVWGRLCQRVWSASSGEEQQQQPVLIGARANRLFGGPPGPSVEGIVVRPGSAPGTYEVDAGELIGAGEGARIALYSELPEDCPLPGSPEESTLKRLGELRVTSASEFGAVAVQTSGAAPVALTPTACGRLIAAVPTAWLKVALDPALDPALRAALVKHSTTDAITYLVESERSRAEAYLGQYTDGSLWLGDRTYGPGPEVSPTEPGPLVRIERGGLDTLTTCTRAVLRHYADYVIPLRLARRSEAADGRKLIEIEAIACPDKSHLQRLLERPGSARPLPRGTNGRVCVRPDQGLAFAINNVSIENLHFVLFDCGASGRIELLNADCGFDINQESRKVLGMADAVDASSGLQPFAASLPTNPGLKWSVDRLVAFATNHKPLLEQMVKLTLQRSFGEVLEAARRRGIPSARGREDASGLIWSAVALEVQIGDPKDA